jgi:hypothetical protein
MNDSQCHLKTLQRGLGPNDMSRHLGHGMFIFFSNLSVSFGPEASGPNDVSHVVAQVFIFSFILYTYVYNLL